MDNKQKSRILNITGTAIMLLVIIMMLPLTLPKLFGLSLYEVLSGSMEPLYKKGGVVYVKPVDVDTVEVGDIVSYVTSSGTNIVTTHRVYAINSDGSFTTKGDANNTVDAEPVATSRIVGKAVFYLPFFGALSAFIFTVKGACVAIMVFGVSVVMWIMASILNPDSSKPKEKKKHISPNVLTGAGVGLIAIAIIATGIWGYSYKKGQNEYNDIRQELKLIIREEGVTQNENSVDEDKDNASSSDRKPGDTSSREIPFMDSTKEEIAKSFEVLSAKYENLIGWITIPDTVIDYPIMHYTDDEKYLRHSYDGSYLYAGSIFLSAYNKGDLSDRYNMIYGHNMNDGYMFSSLLNYDTQEGFYESHPYIYITTQEGMRTYEIFSFFYVYPTDALYTISYYNVADMDILSENMKKAGRIDTGVSVNEDDEIVALSTCDSRGKYRFVVCAKLVVD